MTKVMIKVSVKMMIILTEIVMIPILVTLPRMVTDVNDWHPLKVAPLRLVTLVGIVTDTNAVTAKALLAIVVTLVGIVTDVSDEHP